MFSHLAGTIISTFPPRVEIIACIQHFAYISWLGVSVGKILLLRRYITAGASGGDGEEDKFVLFDEQDEETKEEKDRRITVFCRFPSP